MKQLNYYILLVAICFMLRLEVFAQRPITLKGRVQNQEGKPLSDVNIISVGKGNFKVQKNGTFNINSLSVGDTLKFSHISYVPKSYVVRSNDVNILIVLESNSIRLQEAVFSTGFQYIPKERATGSFEKIDSLYINRSPASNILTRVKSMISGMYSDNANANFNNTGKFANESLNIHGVSSIRGANYPLIIVDNFPYSGDINAINPNDVENITVLKDAAASSIWGAQAGNGVIVITTKRGKQNSSLVVEASQNTAVVQKPDLFKRQAIANADLIAVQLELYNKGYYNSNINSRSKPILPMAIEAMEKKKKGLLTEAELNDVLDTYGQTDIRNDLLKYLYRPAISSQYSFSVSGGGDRNSFRISTGYDRSKGTQVSSDNNRFTLKAYNKFKLTRKLEAELDMMYSRLESRQTQLLSYYDNSGSRYPYSSLATADGQFLSIPYNYSIGYIESLADPNLLDWTYKPLEELQHNKGNAVLNSLLTSASLNYQINKLFGLSFRYRNEIQKNDDETVFDQYSIRSRGMVNLYTNVGTNGVVSRPIPVGGILEFGSNNAVSHFGRFQVDFKWNDHPDHRVNVILGSEVSAKAVRAFTDGMYGYDGEKLVYSTQIDYMNRYPTYNNLASNAQIPSFITKSQTNNRYVSLFGNGSYTLLNRYTVSGSFRKDASNVFGVNTNDKWNPLWSAGLSWNIKKERFMEAIAVNELKFRATYGFSGNIDPSRSGNTTIQYSTLNALYGISWPSAQVLVAPNPSLRWEKIKTFNLGLDYSLFNSRISGSVDMYWKKSFDLIHLYPLDPTVGLISQLMNVADVDGRGVDVRLSSINFNKRFKWRTDFIFTYNNNWVKKTFVDYPGASSLVSSSFIAYKDVMPYAMYSYKFAGLDPQTGEPVGYFNGEVSKDYSKMAGKQAPIEDLKLHGSKRPLIYGTVNSFFDYKKFNLSFSLLYQFKYFFRRPSISYSDLYSRGDGHPDFYSRWQKPGDEKSTTIPAMTYPLNKADGFYGNSEVLVEPGDHIRLQDIKLQYRLGDIRPLHISQLSFFIYLSNLGVIWRKNDKGLDPSYPNAIPVPKQYTFGVNLKF